MKMEINGAVFIIGSLFWDPNQGDKINLRKNWRRDRLIMKEKIHVKAPIRYGRLSGKNNDKHYTMIFTKSCDNNNNFGTAYIVPFKKNPIRSIRGLVNQARFLSESEGANDKKLCKGKNNKWCTIGLLFNPNIDKKIKSDVLNKWKEILVKDGGLNDFKDYKISKEKSVLSSNGEILINWPRAVDNKEQQYIDKLDIIIATCTKPNLLSYPNVHGLKESLNRDKRKYFYQNLKHGITTFQDRDILN